MNLKEARRARYEATIALEQAQAALRRAEVTLDELEAAAGKKAALDRFLSRLTKAEKKRYHANVALAEQLLDSWSEDEMREWYICQRKVLHMTWAEAEEAGKHEARLHPYLCVWCTGYHKGGGEFRDQPPARSRVLLKLVDAVHKLQPYRDPPRG